MDTKMNYKKLAYLDTIALLLGNITQDEFVQRYKTNAARSSDYAEVIAGIVHDVMPVFDDNFAQKVGMQVADFAPLMRADKDWRARRLVPALFSVAYTRAPNGRRASDGQPETYDRHYNIGFAPARALQTLATTGDMTPAMEYIYDEYFFPRVTPAQRKTGLISNAAVLESIRHDFDLCSAQNAKMTVQGMSK